MRRLTYRRRRSVVLIAVSVGLAMLVLSCIKPLV